MCVSKTWFPGKPVVRFDMDQAPHHSEKKSKSIWNVLCVRRRWQGHSRINHIGSISWQVTFVIWVQPHLYGLFPPGYHCLGCCWLDKAQSCFKGLLWSLLRSGSREIGWTCIWGLNCGRMGGISWSSGCQGKLLLQQLHLCKLGASLVRNVMVSVMKLISVLGLLGLVWNKWSKVWQIMWFWN